MSDYAVKATTSTNSTLLLTAPAMSSSSSSNTFTKSSLLAAPPASSSSLIVPTTAQQKLNTGSATGNPRNKCALKPGYSLMAWVRLGNSGEDLSGTRGRVVPVTIDELAKHNTRDDAWLALRGNVYNVTRYMDFHPGGVDELMRGVGTDATKLFDKEHAWVNYQQLLAKCYVGPLRGHIVKIDNDLLKALQTKVQKDNNGIIAKNTTTLLPPATAKPGSTASTTTATASTRIPTASTTQATEQQLPEIVPRFDWIQKSNELTFYFYTRPFCNPGLIVHRQHTNQNNKLELRIQIANETHVFAFELHADIKWPPKFCKLSSETGKIELKLEKAIVELWTSYGSMSTRRALQYNENGEEWQQHFQITANTNFNHDSYELCLRCLNANTIMLLPIGYHVTISACVNGADIQRSYTPVPIKYLHNSRELSYDFTHLCFLLKTYEFGLLSAHMHQLQVGAALQLSAAKGSLNLRNLREHRRLALIAAGSGLTPFLALIEHLLQRITNKIEYLQLLYFNKTEADIWCKEALTKLSTEDERFHFKNILSQPCDASKWTGLCGRISLELLTPLTTKNTEEHVTFIACCGPSAFNECVVNMLNELNFSTNDYHIFQG